ncbi:MAG: mannose-1-phosphate guanylyltransferase [Candidatus Cloacimonas sp.]
MIALIMAGGSGTRFWPRSRKNLPKQFLKLEGNLSLLQMTVQRLLPSFSLTEIYIVTAQNQVELIKEQLPELPAENIIIEPFGMNTAPCIALSVEYLKKFYDPEEVLFILPSDHIIHSTGQFLSSLILAEEQAKSGLLITFGILPIYPATGYGYIEAGEEIVPGLRKVLNFKEKPDQQTAELFLAQGNYYWNSGMFCWSLKSISAAFANLLPEVHNLTAQISKIWQENGLQTDIASLYAQMPRLPIDIGIMEKAQNRGIIPVSYDWSDVGSWKALSDLMDGDDDGNYFATSGKAISASDNYIDTTKFTALIGVNDLCLIETADAILLCRKEKSEEVKKIVEFLQQTGREDLL